MAQTIKDVVNARRAAQTATVRNADAERLRKVRGLYEVENDRARLERARQAYAQNEIAAEKQRQSDERDAILARVQLQTRGRIADPEKAEQQMWDDEYDIARRATENAAQLRQDIQDRVRLNKALDTQYKTLYPNSGVINTATGMGKGVVIGATKQAPAGLAGLATAAHEGAGTFWNMITTPVKDGEINYEDYISPLRDDAQRMKAEADRLSAENLAGRAPGAQRLVGVSQAAGNMAATGAIGGALGGLTGLAGLATAAVGAGAGGSAYIDAVTQGAGVDEAMAYGALVGATEAFTERLFGGNPLLDTKPGLVNQLIKKIGGSDKLMRYLASKPVEMVNEGMEEAVATIMEPVFQRLTYDPNASAATLEEIMDSAIDGVLLSGMLQGGAAAINSAKNIGAKKPTEALAEPATTDATVSAETEGNIFAEGTEAEVKQESTAETATFESKPAEPAKPATNAEAKQIMNDPAAMQELGIDTNGKTASQIRTEIKDKLNEIRQQRVERQQTEQATPEGMGAASYGFDPFSNLANKYGTIPEGENPARVVDVPKKTSDTENVSHTARTAMEAEATPEEMLPNIEEGVISGKYSDVPISNTESKAKADEKLKYDGWDKTLDDWRGRIRSGKTTADDIALGWTLYNNAANRAAEDIRAGGNGGEAAREAVSILTDMVNEQRNNARKLQAQRILKKLSPEYQMYAIQRSIDSINDEIQAKHGDKVSLSNELYEKFLAAETAEARDDVLDEIYRDIARQMPPTTGEMLRAWRYTAMLGNLKTQSRNIVGNLANKALTSVSNFIAGGIESAINPKTRQRAILNRMSGADRALIGEAATLYDSVSDAILTGGKHGDYLKQGMGNQDINSRIEKYRQDNVFTSKNGLVNGLLFPARTYRAFTNWMMEGGDALFAKPAFTTSLASWLKANKYTAEDIAQHRIDPKRLDEGVAFAVDEARKAVYRDHNAFSDMVSRFGRMDDSNKVSKVVSTAADALVPFRRTPANVAVRMYEYSPLSVASIVGDAVKLKNGEMNASDFINTISKTATGTTLVAAGYLLAKEGVLHAGADEDEKQAEFDAMQGVQEYSVNVGGQSYTIDSLAPASVPLFIGAELWQQFAENEGYKEMNAWDFFSAAAKSFNPMEQMSMISGLTDALADLDEEQGFVASLIYSTAKNYASQYVPTVFGQIERTKEGGERRQTYIDRESDVPKSVQYTAATLGNKWFGEYNQIPYIDAWGRREKTGDMATTAGENFVLPWYSKKLNTTEVDEQLQELYDKGYKDVLPKAADKATTYKGKDGKDVYLTPDEYVEYAEKRGQKGYDLIETALGNNRLSDAQTARVIDKLYDFANQYGKAEATKFGPDSWVDKYFNKSDGKIVDKAIYMTEMTELKKQAEAKGGTLEYDRKLIDHMLNLGVDEDVLLESASDPKTDKLRKGYNEVGEDAGFSVADWIDLYKYVDGSKKDEVKQYARDMGLDEKQFETLWKYYYPPKSNKK